MDNFGMCGLLINGTPLDTYEGAALLDYSVGETSIKNETFQGINRSTWHLLKSIYGLRKITLTIVFTGPTRRAVTLQRSKLNGALFGASELYISDDGFFYDVTVESCGPEILVGEGEREVKIKSEYTFTGTRRDALVSETIPGGEKIFCKSTMPFTDARLKTTVGGTQPRTFSGPVVTFEKSPTNVLNWLSAEINPVQNLNGYDNPWPAGGGKNILPYPYSAASGTYNGVAITVNNDGTVNFSGTASGTAFFNLRSIAGKFMLKAGSYVVSGQVSGSVIVVGRASDNTAIGSTNINNGQFSISEDTEVFAFIQINSGNSVNGVAKPMIRLSSVADSTFAPYANICPISGWTGATVTRTGKNLWNPSFFTDNGFTENSGVYSGSSSDLNGVVLSIPPTDRAVMSLEYKGATTSRAGYFKFVYSDGSNNYPIDCKEDVWTTKTAVSTNGKTVIGIIFGRNNAVNMEVRNFQLELGSTVSSYETYQGQTYNIDLDGTRYGGTLDVTTGKLTVDRVMADLGDFTWQKTTAIDSIVMFRTAENTTSLNTNYHLNGLCSDYTVYGGNYSNGINGVAHNNNSMWLNSTYWGTGYLRWIVRDDRYADADEATFKTAVTGVKVVYPLATPIEVDLTPTEITLFAGENNLFSDANGNLELTYLADGNASEIEALNILLGGQYSNNHGEDDPTDREALNILLGGNER